MYTCSYNTAFLVLYSYFSWWVSVCVCVPAYWASRVCGGKWGAEERWSMGAWRVAAEGSWWSTATRTASCLSTHPSRCCAGKYSEAIGATACVSCGAGERDACCSRVIWCPLNKSSLCAYGGGGCSTRIYVDSGKSIISIYSCFNSCCTQTHPTHTHTHTYIHTYMYTLYSCFSTALPLSKYLSDAILLYSNIYLLKYIMIYVLLFTPTVLLYLLCVFACVYVYSLRLYSYYIIYIYLICMYCCL